MEVFSEKRGYNKQAYNCYRIKVTDTKQIRELLIKYGANKLSEIDPSKYSSLLGDVGELR